MHTDRRINPQQAVRKPQVLLEGPSGIDGSDHLIAKAIHRLGSIGDLVAQRIAWAGLSSVVQGEFKPFWPHLYPDKAFLAPVINLCAFYQDPYRRPIGPSGGILDMTVFSWRERRDSNPGTSRCLKYNGSERIIAPEM
jgi:hypothetical protein